LSASHYLLTHYLLTHYLLTHYLHTTHTQPTQAERKIWHEKREEAIKRFDKRKLQEPTKPDEQPVPKTVELNANRRFKEAHPKQTIELWIRQLKQKKTDAMVVDTARSRRGKAKGIPTVDTTSLQITQDKWQEVCTHNLHTTYTQPTHNLHTTYTQPTHDLHTTYTQPTHTLR